MRLILTLTLTLSLVPIFGASAWAQKTQKDSTSDFKALAREGESVYQSGKTCALVGGALIPVGLLALVPVVYDGAFGITAADPGIGGSILALSAGLIHLGIPIMGTGVSREAMATRGLYPASSEKSKGWDAYDQSWKWIGAGGALILVSVPFGIVAALDMADQRPGVKWIAGTLLYGGLTAGGVGVLHQYYSGYQFIQSHKRVQRRLLEPVSLSIQPILRLTKQGSGGIGFKLIAEI